MNENAVLDKSTAQKTPVTVRFLFEKGGRLIYISHLDLARTLTRAFVRARLPLWYTEGFNPHPKLVFSTPLSVGTESRYELLDLRLSESVPLNDVLCDISRELPEDIRFLRAYYPETKFSAIKYSGYDICFKDEKISKKTAGLIEKLFSASPVEVMKHTKSGDKITDIFPCIKSLEAHSKEGELFIKTILTASSEDFLNPEYLTEVIKNSFGFPDSDNITKSLWSVCRTCLYDKDLKPFI